MNKGMMLLGDGDGDGVGDRMFGVRRKRTEGVQPVDNCIGKEF